MSVLKWVLIVIGFIALLTVLAGVGAYFWARTIEPVKLTEADLQAGGAYTAQERWLGLFGHSLEQDFELDGFSLLAKTRCMF